LELQRDVFSKRFQGSTVCHLNDNGECSFLDRLGQSKRLGVGSCRQFLCCVMVAALSVRSAIAPNRCRCDLGCTTTLAKLSRSKGSRLHRHKRRETKAA
jgi:hypothetical protein